jgi:hypothetical protein
MRLMGLSRFSIGTYNHDQASGVPTKYAVATSVYKESPIYLQELNAACPSEMPRENHPNSSTV